MRKTPKQAFKIIFNKIIMNYIELKSSCPKTFHKLERWFILLYDIPNADVVVEENRISLTNGIGFVYLHLRDLYSFFDYVNIKPFVLPSEYPNFKISIQSSKSIKEFDDIFEDRIYAEMEVFKKCFQYSEIMLNHKKNG